MLAVAGASLASHPVRAAQDATAGSERRLILEVRINGVRSTLLWEFVQLPDKRIATTADRLRRLGIIVREAVPGAERVPLDTLAGIRYHYIEAAQVLEIDADDKALVPIVLDAGRAPVEIDLDKVARNTGVLLNYGLYADVGDGARLAAQYDLRILTRIGVVSTTGFANWLDDRGQGAEHVRLDTNWRSIDVRNAIALTVGDTIGGGGSSLASAYRMGGIQMQRNFDSRPDLVTTALPVLNGSAAVPSAIDLYLNGLRYFSGTVGRGPFQFRSLPNLGGGATATIVMTDASGRETRIDKQVFFVPSLLPSGKLDFSVEAGFPRFNYGAQSFDYLSQIAASGSARYGISDAVTLEGHFEGTDGLVGGGLGGTVRLGGFGAVTVGAAASRFRARTGARVMLHGQARFRGVDFYGGIERSDARYQTLVGATALKAARRVALVAPSDPDTFPHPVTGTKDDPVLVAFARKVDRFGASFSLLAAGVNLSYTRVRFVGEDLRVANFSVQRALSRNVSVWTNGYRQWGTRRGYGVLLGLSVVLGRGSTVTAHVAHSGDTTRISSNLNYNTGHGEGSWSFNVANSEVVAGTGTSYRSVDARYRGYSATVGGGIDSYGGSTRINGFVEGSVVAMGGVFLAPTVDRSFAVVRGAGPGTPLLVDSRRVAQADARGRALLPSLRSLESNRIEIDPRDLPLDLNAPRTEITVVPDYRAGVIVDFGVARQASAVVILVDGANVPLPVGSLAIIEGGGAPTVVGHDGRVYLTGLGTHNRLVVQREDVGECRVSFDFAPVAGMQAQIGPLICR